MKPSGCDRQMMTTRELAQALNIGREAARRLMKTTRGVLILPPLTGKGKNVTRRMPRAVFERLLAESTVKLRNRLAAIDPMP